MLIIIDYEGYCWYFMLIKEKIERDIGIINKDYIRKVIIVVFKFRKVVLSVCILMLFVIRIYNICV